MPHFMISVLSRDRVGIVHEVARALSELGGDIADLRQSVLRGYFTMILQVACPPGTTADDLQRQLVGAGERGGGPLQVCVAVLEGEAPAKTEADLANAYVLTASGHDRIGFVAEVTRLCAENGVNILDLSTAVGDGSYTMILLVDLSGADSVEALRQVLARFRRETGMTVDLQHYDLFKATNEVSMR